MAESKPKSRKKKLQDSSYWASTHRPLQCLMLLLPLVVLYEVGVLLYATEFIPELGQVSNHIVARTMLVEFFSRLHIQVPGLYLPGLILIVVLVGWHIGRKDPWRIEPKLYGWMFIESAGLALPIFTIHLAVFYMVMALQNQIDPSQLSHLLAETASISEPGHWQRRMVWSVGAGIYEELLFRLIGVSVLYLLFVKIIRMKELAGTALAVGICALLFAGYHFPSLESFNLPTFLFYTAAGIYLGVVYLSRGFGIAVTTHALYDVMVVAMTYQTQASG